MRRVLEQLKRCKGDFGQFAFSAVSEVALELVTFAFAGSSSVIGVACPPSSPEPALVFASSPALLPAAAVGFGSPDDACSLELSSDSDEPASFDFDDATLLSASAVAAAPSPSGGGELERAPLEEDAAPDFELAEDDDAVDLLRRGTRCRYSSVISSYWMMSRARAMWCSSRYLHTSHITRHRAGHHTE